MHTNLQKFMLQNALTANILWLTCQQSCCWSVLMLLQDQALALGQEEVSATQQSWAHQHLQGVWAATEQPMLMINVNVACSSAAAGLQSRESLREWYSNCRLFLERMSLPGSPLFAVTCFWSGFCNLLLHVCSRPASANRVCLLGSTLVLSIALVQAGPNFHNAVFV